MSEEKEGLMEKALRAYEERQRQWEERRKEETQDFAEEARKEFAERFETEPEVVSPVSPSKCFLECDGLKFRAERSIYGTLFFIMKNCGRCGRIFEKKVRSLEEIGTVLVEMHFCEECEGRSEKIEEEPSTEEKIVKKLCEVLEMLRDYDMDCG